jgi:hypothetical protein
MSYTCAYCGREFETDCENYDCPLNEEIRGDEKLDLERDASCE